MFRTTWAQLGRLDRIGIESKYDQHQVMKWWPIIKAANIKGE
jgi:hypothetical protein